MSKYLIRLLDATRAEVAATYVVGDPSWGQKPSTASPFTANLELTDSVSKALGFFNFVQIYRNNQELYTGVITQRQLSDVLTIEGYTEEFLLRNVRCPIDYGSHLSGIPLGTAVKHVLKGGWGELAVKLQSDWDGSNVTLVNTVSSTADNGLIQLQKSTSLEYLANGSVTVIFDSQDILDFKHWEVVRWLSTFADDVATGLQYQFAETMAGFTAEGWAPSDNTPFGASSTVLGLAGYLTDSAGLALANRTERFAGIRVNLATNDTTTPNHETAATAKGFTPTVQFIQMLARTNEQLYLTEMSGGFPNTDDFLIGNITASDSNGLELIQRIFTNVNTRYGSSWEFLALDGELHIGNPLGEDMTNDVLLSTGRE